MMIGYKLSVADLTVRQQWSLDEKVEFTKYRLRQFVDVIYPKNAYVSYSGGEDSTVLLHMARQLYPDMPAVFMDTGLEYPEIREFVKETDNVTVVYPKRSFYDVLKTDGFPVVSKEVSKNISRARGTKDPVQKEYRMWGTKNGKYVGRVGIIPEKWHYLIDAPFKISDRCCDVMKKNPVKAFNKKTGMRPILGSMACESNRRKMSYMKVGCNSFEAGKEASTPMGFWMEDDIWAYIKKYNVPYSRIYDMGERRTGCIFCMFGCQMEEEPNRFQRMKQHHPDLHKYCLDQLGLRPVLELLRVPYE
jgi:3'-phosphoadenosine 5'-phosphosulfate sulfotransferase (PAPS reductase)/FAD synthetase